MVQQPADQTQQSPEVPPEQPHTRRRRLPWWTWVVPFILCLLGSCRSAEALADGFSSTWFLLLVIGLAVVLGVSLLAARVASNYRSRIAQREGIEQVLLDKGELLSTLLDSMPDYIYVKDRESRFVLTNLANARALGAASVDEIIGKTDFDFFPRELAERYRADEKKLMETDQPLINHEEPVQYQHVDVRWHSTTKVPLHDSVGEIVGLVGVSRDITDHKLAQEALAHERNLLRTLFDTIPDYVYVKDTGSRFLATNMAHVEALGASSLEQVIGKTDFDFYPHKMAEQFRAHDLKVVQTGEPLVNYEEKYIDGLDRSRWVVTSKMPLRDSSGSIIGLVGIGREITDRKQVEKAFEEEQNLLRTVIDALPEYIYVKDTECKFITNNAAHRKALRVESEEEVIGKTDFDFFPPQLAEQYYADDQAVIQTGQPLLDHEQAREDRAGNKRWVIVSKVAFRDSAGSIVGLVGITRDITRRKRAEEERQKLEEQIQHSQKLESLGVLAGGIAHDFNNLLMGILGNAGMAKLELPPSSPTRPMIDQIEKTGQRAADLCKQMLAYSGKGSFVVQPLDLSELVKEMSHLLEVSASKKATVKYHFTRKLPAIMGDPTQLRQVVINLITNASEAIGDQTGIISVTTGAMYCDRAYLQEGYVAEELPEGRYAYLEVSDTGCGIDNEKLGKIFDPFYSTKFAGRGLGLAAVLGIVRGHKGVLKVYSEPSRGTTFKVLFPFCDQPAASTTEESLDTLEWRGSGIILVVDDEEMVRDTAKRMLEHFGFTVLLASDGREGVEQFRLHAGEIAAVLLDVTMPHMSGEEAFREIRRIKSNACVLLSSGYNELDATSHFSGKGLAGFIQKPYRPVDLMNKLRDVLAS